MLSNDRFYSLSWLYVLYRSLDQHLPYFALSFDHLYALITSRLSACQIFPAEKLREFCSDLSCAINAVPHPFRKDLAFLLPEHERAYIACHFNLVSLKLDHRWIQDFDLIEVENFSRKVDISREESQAFFHKLIQELRGETNLTPVLKAVL